MRNDTVFYRPVSSAKTYREFLSGTVTVNHTDGETVKLRSRSGRVFENDSQSRPKTGRSNDGSLDPTKHGHKLRTTANQQRFQNQHKVPDTKLIAKLMTEKYCQEEMCSNSKDMPRQVPLWLVHQILNSDVELNEQEKAKLFANGVEPLKSPRNTPVPGTPTPGCPACGMHSKCNISGTKKQKEAFSIVPKKLELRTPKATIVYRNKAVPTIKPRTIRSAPAISQTSPRKQMLHYTSPMAVRRDVRSSEERMAKPNLPKATSSSSPSHPKGKWSDPTPPPTTVSNGFRFKVITPASRANLCREMKMHAYTHGTFQNVVWPFPLVNGLAVNGQVLRSSSNNNASISPPKENATSKPRDVSKSAEISTRKSRLAPGYANIAPSKNWVCSIIV